MQICNDRRIVDSQRLRSVKRFLVTGSSVSVMAFAEMF
jgi:hypothetical protein